MSLEIVCMKSKFQITGPAKPEHKTKYMKKFFTLLLSSIFSLSLLAFDGNRLSVSVVSNKMDLKIEIDGKRYSMQQDNSFTLQNLREGNHTVKIYSEMKKRNGLFAGKKQDVIFNSSVYLRRGYHTDITVNRFGKVFTDERRIDANDDWYESGYGYGDRDDNEGWSTVVSKEDFSFLKDEMRKEWQESARMEVAKTAMEGNRFTTSQVKELMYLFTFESNRVEIAKYAYRLTADKENYSDLIDILLMNSSKDDLARFIRQSR